MEKRSLDDLDLVIAVESVLIGLSMYQGWSSRVRADNLLDMIKKYLQGEELKVKKPWEYFAVGDVNETL